LQNDLMIKEALLGKGVYAMPIGNAGAAMVDTRDIADVAGPELLSGTAPPMPTATAPTPELPLSHFPAAPKVESGDTV
jgi:hypothetical protein